MIARARWAARSGGAALLAAWAAGAAFGQEIDAGAQARGLALYLNGAPGVQACAGCHGRDAGGGAEGSLRAPALTRLAARGYDGAQALARVLVDGVAPGGRRLSPGMPRTSALAGQEAALLAGIAAAARADAIGVSDDAIMLHAPADGPDDAFPARLRAALAARLGETGVFGRRIELREGEGEALVTLGLPETIFGAQAKALAAQGRPNLFARGAPVGDERPHEAIALGPTLSALARAAERLPECGGGVEIGAGAAADLAWRLGMTPTPGADRARCRLALVGRRAAPPVALLARRGETTPLVDDPLIEAGLSVDAYADFVAARVVAALIAAGPRPGRTSFLKALRAGDGLEATARRVDLAYPRISAQIPIAFRPLDADPPAKTARTP